MALRTSLVAQPHLYIGDTTGRPLDGGKVYFGQVNKDPELHPINVFYDEGLSIPAAQPVRTKGGFMYANGDMAEIYAAETRYSVKVLDSYGRQVFYKPDMQSGLDVSDEINTIEDMIALYAPTNGTRVTVKGSQGGSFEYNSSKSTLNDGGTVFNGWVRIHFLTHNLVEWFGAKWDGTDTTAALDKAIIESAKQKRLLNFGGSDRTYTVNTARHFAGWQPCAFLIRDDMHLRGNGCKIIADNRETNLPTDEHSWFYRFFTCDYTRTTNNVSVIGIDFDTQFDKYSDAKHQIAGIFSSGGVVNNVLIQDCNFYNSSGTNAVGCYLENSELTLPRNWRIIDCNFINSGYGGDCSPVYLMCDDAEVKVNVLQRFDTVEKNLWAANAIEIHGDNQNVHHCLIDKVGGGIIAGDNHIHPIKNTMISNNIVNSYGGGITIWNGEGLLSKGQDDITIANNTVRVLPHLKDGDRLGIGVGVFGVTVNTVIISNNTVICEDVSDATTLATPIFFNYNAEGTGYAVVGTLHIRNNTTRGAFGIRAGSSRSNHAINDSYITDNVISIDHTKSGITPIGINIKHHSRSDVINNRSLTLAGNMVRSAAQSATIAYQVSGQVGELTLDNQTDVRILKYNIIDAPDIYLHSDDIKQPTNLSSSLVAITPNKMRFKIDLTGMRVSGAGNSRTLCTMPVGSVIDSVVLVQNTKVEGAAAVNLSIGDSIDAGKYLKSVALSTSGGGIVSGLKTTEKGSAFTGASGSYVTELEPIIIHLSAVDLQGIVGSCDVVVNFSYV